MIEKKMVRRSDAITLGIICIVLVASLGGVVLFLNAKVIDLQNQTNEWRNIANLNKTEVWVTNRSITLGPYLPSSNYPNNNSQMFFATTNYSGYVEVDLQTNTSTSSYYFLVQYSYRDLPRFYTQGYYTFYWPDIYIPIASLPYSEVSSNLVITIFNNSTDTLQGNLTLTYYY